MEEYRTLRKFVYVSETVIGFLFIFLAWEMSNAAEMVCHSMLYQIPSAILVVAGMVSILFGVDALIVQSEPDAGR